MALVATNVMNTFQDISAVFGTLQATHAFGCLVVGQLVIFVCNDGISVPWYMTKMEKRLTAIKEILNNLTAEQKQRINEIQRESNVSLESLEKRWSRAYLSYNLLVMEHNETSLGKRILGWAWYDNGSKGLNKEILNLQRKVLATTTYYLKEEMREEQAARELQAREDEDDRRLLAIIAGGPVPSGTTADCPIQLLPTVSPESTGTLQLAPNATTIPLRAHFKEIPSLTVR